ncbi:FMN-dependent NADH-azoreductase [Roseovarius sp. B08]|uniref:FMN-dependent NADH-azoreductase n=1 Tax=Roseovarius sp. B08 TaxID=3449223 RepID=UPI003EDC7497
MKSALLVHASPMGTDARGHALAEHAMDNLRRRHPGLRTIYRDLSQGGFGWIGRDYAHAVLSGAAPHAPEFSDSEALIRELEQTDALIVSTPMHNYTVPATLKIWIDLVLRVGRSFGFRDGRKVGLLADRPTLILVASGGAVTQQAGAMQPDYLTGYMRDVFATIGLEDLRFIHLECLARPELADKALAAGKSQLNRMQHFGTNTARIIDTA